MSTVHVLIAGVGGGGYGVEILKALRLSGEEYCIHTVDMSPRSLGLFLSDESTIVPPAAAKDYLKKLTAICKKQKIQVLIPGSDPDLKAISQHRAVFEKQGIYIPINSKAVIDAGFNKLKTIELLKKYKFPTPRTIIAKDSKELSAVDFYPVIIKPYVGGGGSSFTFLAQDREELDFFFQYLLKCKMLPMIQEYVGTPEQEYTIGVLNDKKGNVISTVGMRRFLQGGLSTRLRVKDLVVSSGISQGEIIRDPKILNEAVRIAKAVGSRGPINIQGRYAKGKFYTFEINPRFSGTTYQRALAGVNEPDLCIRKYVLKEILPKTIRPRSGMILRGLFEKFIPAV